MKLHEAMIQVLQEKGNLSFKELAKIIDDKRLYMKKDMSVLTPSQVRLRAKQYSNLFNVDNDIIGIK